MAIKKEQVVIRLTPRQKQQLQTLANKMQMNMSEFIRLQIENLINEDK